jgi:hypothetical protein
LNISPFPPGPSDLLGIFPSLSARPSADAVVSTLQIHFIIPPSKKERQKKDGKAAVRSEINIYNIARYKERRCYLSSNIIDTAACKGKLFSFLPSLVAAFSICRKGKVCGVECVAVAVAAHTETK